MSSESQSSNTDIAIIGYSCRFPEADNPHQFLENLKNGKDCVRPISGSRIAATGLSEDADYNDLGYIEQIDLFDHDFFNISFAEAEKTDPRLRLLLEVVHETIEHSGYGPVFFDNSDTSVYVGDTQLDYYQLSEELDATLASNSINSSLAGRIARMFNLRGTAEMIDTSCSSSLAALRHGCNDLILNESEYSLVCASRLSLRPDLKENNALLGIVSPDGKARSFSDEANGTIWGEAVVCLLLKPLTSARKDRDIIHAVIKSVAMNQDAALSPSITAPDSQAQSEVLIKAWKKAGINPGSVSFIEAHGTGTKLGDPIEIAGLDMAFGQYTARKGFCAISSLKSNIGHTDSAAGLAGILKTILSLKHQLLFPSLHFKRPNPFINFEDSAVYVNTNLRPWPAGPGELRRAGVSSFGLSGTNGHVVLEEAPGEYADKAAAVETSPEDRLITVSGKSVSSLKKNLKTLISYLQANPHVALSDISYTLNTGRESYPFRFATVVRDHSRLIKDIQKFLSGEKIEEELPRYETPIFVFSHESKVTTAILDEFLKYDAFRNSYDETLRYTQGLQDTDIFRSFAFQYAFYTLLTGFKVPFRAFMGDGSGQLVIDVVKEKISLEEGIRKLSQCREGSEDIVGRVERFVEKAFEGKQLLFCGMGPEGNISRALSRLSGNNKFKLISVSNQDESMLLGYVRQLHLAGISVELKSLYQDTACRKVELPTYQFSRKRCWLSEYSANNYLHILEWQPVSLNDNGGLNKGTFLLFENGTANLSASLSEYAESKNHRCVVVKAGEGFSKESPFSYYIRHWEENDFTLLKESVLRDFDSIEGLFILPDTDDSAPDKKLLYLEGQVKPFFLLLRTWEPELRQGDFYLTVVTFGAYAVKGYNTAISLLARLLEGLVRGVYSDYLSQRIKSVDFSAISEFDAESVYNEFSSQDHLNFTAYRAGQRFVPVITGFSKLSNRSENKIPSLSEGDVYIVSGGLGGIGREIIRSVALRAKSHFIILGRSIKDYQMEKDRLEKLGSVSSFYRVDIADKKAMKEVFKSITADFSKIKGVIHAAGVSGKREDLGRKAYQEVLDTLSPKVTGTLLLDEYAGALNPEFFVLFSSLNAIVPQKRSSDYAAANAFLEAYPQYKKGSGCSYICISWPVWKGVGMGHHNHDPEQDLLKSVTREQGVEIFFDILAQRPANVYVAPVNLNKFKSNGFFLTPGEVLSDVPGDDKIDNNDWQNPLAEIIAIWEKVLKTDGITETDDFFDLGGHSLNGGQVVSEISRRFSVQMEFEQIYEYPTPVELAAFVEKNSGKTEKSTIRFDLLPEMEFYETSPAQKRLWLIHQLGENMTAYNIPCLFHLGGDLNIRVLTEAYEALIERHESFRTTFISVGGKPCQKISPFRKGEYTISITDLTAENEPEKECEQRLSEEFHKTFDLEKGPLIRAFLFKITPSRYVFSIVMHHLITDGWSIRVMTQDFTTLYKAFADRTKNPLKPLEFQYKEYAAWLNSQLNGAEFLKQKKYWIQKLRPPLTFTEFPLDFPRGEVKTYEGDQVIFKLDKNQTQQLREFCRERGVTLFVGLTTVLKVLLHKYSGNHDVIIGAPVAGRNLEELKNQVGYYLNTIVLRTFFGAATDFNHLLDRIKADVLESMEHQLYPIDQIISSLELKREKNRSPLFETGFTWFPKVHDSREEEGEDPVDMEDHLFTGTLNNSQHDLWLYGTEYEADILLTFEFNTAIIKAESIELLAREFTVGLARMMENPSVRISELNIDLSEGPSDDQLENFNFSF